MFNAILASVIVSLMSLTGAVLFFRKKYITGRYGGALLSMAAGVMLVAAVLDLLPEAVALYSGKELYWAFLFGICLFFVMERMIHWYHHHTHLHQREQEIQPAAYLVLVGDSLHNFFDGLAIAAAFSVGVELGVVTTVAIILHEIPSEMADFITLIHSGFKFWKALLYNLLSGLTAIAGVLAGWYFLAEVKGALAFLLAFNAGMFIYISCSDLIPALHEDFKKDKRWLQTLTFLLGIVLMSTVIGTLEPERDDLVKNMLEEPSSADSGVRVEIKNVPSTSHLEAGN